MKNTLKLIICATLSLLIGIAAAAPLLASELNIRPWTTHIQGPTANFNLDLVYANFTTENPDAPITETSGPTINYFAVINVTNPSEYPAQLLVVNFLAAQKITNSTGQPPFGITDGNWSTGSAWEAEGVWLDGVWYNVSYVDGNYPFFDENGIMTEPPYPAPSVVGHWMEGVQLFERISHNNEGTTTRLYLNMNGTWTDVTGKVTVDRPVGQSYTITGVVADQNIFFQPFANCTLDDNIFGYSSSRNIWAGKDAFDNLFTAGQSRLIVVTGSWEVRNPWTSTINQIDVLESGTISLKINAHNSLDINPDLGYNKFLDTWSDATMIQQIPLTKIGNSYIYNVVLSDNQMFQLDQYGAEAFITERS
jgi:hypothetical protein